MCFYCKGVTKRSMTAIAVQHGNHVIVIKNVPCEECAQCGATEVSDEVMQIVEQMADQARKTVNTDTVIDYTMVA